MYETCTKTRQRAGTVLVALFTAGVLWACVWAVTRLPLMDAAYFGGAVMFNISLIVGFRRSSFMPSGGVQLGIISLLATSLVLFSASLGYAEASTVKQGKRGRAQLIAAPGAEQELASAGLKFDQCGCSQPVALAYPGEHGQYIYLADNNIAFLRYGTFSVVSRFDENNTSQKSGRAQAETSKNEDSGCDASSSYRLRFANRVTGNRNSSLGLN